MEVRRSGLWAPGLRRIIVKYEQYGYNSTRALIGCKEGKIFFVMSVLGNLIVDHPCYGQLTAVKKGFSLISVT